MLSLVSLNVKCPLCGHSLMDEERKLDNEHSIALRYRMGKQEGWVRLSSVYGSFLVESEFPIPHNAVVEISCPHCHQTLESTVNCEVCLAPMVPLVMQSGGRLFICSRRGCRKHYLEFEDAEVALSAFYDRHCLEANLPSDHRGDLTEVREDYEQRTTVTMTKGTYLYAYCPHCHHSLIGRNTIGFIVTNQDGKEGNLALSPYLNVFTHCSTIEIPEGEQVKDLLCPHCRHSLLAQEQNCERCGSRTARITVSAMRKLITFYICLRKGCTWHGISDEDAQAMVLEDSLEW
jgi:ssDNA-binding Zn-finger/Zn-ribbon topoisomerase 1